MVNKHKRTANLSLVIGILGLMAGIGLLFTESWFIGLFGAIASAGMAYMGYRQLKASNS